MERRASGLISNIVWLCIIVIIFFAIYLINEVGFQYKPGTELRINPTTGLYNEEVIRNESNDLN